MAGRREGLAGGTVVRAVAGFTGHAGVQTTSLVDAGGKLPLIVQFVDTEENIARVLPLLREMEHLQDLEMEWPAAPFVTFVQIDGDLPRMVRTRLITVHDVEVMP